MIAKPIVKNKYWIVESDGSKVATIQAIDEGGFVYVHGQQREKFPSIKVLGNRYNIAFESVKPTKAVDDHTCYGYPCDSKPYNQMWDVQKRLPVYSKSNKSKSFYCAGYYVVKYNNAWVPEYCPKAITTNRYKFYGPYASEAQQRSKLAELTKEDHGTTQSVSENV